MSAASPRSTATPSPRQASAATPTPKAATPPTDYDPYGTPAAIDAPARDLAVDADVVYYARNRDYRPDLGRWVQRDPNGTSAAEQMTGRPSHGLGLGTEVLIADIDVLYGDGLSLHAPFGSSPLVHTDPTGLSLVGSMGSSVTMLVSNLLARPILGKVAMTGGRVAYSVIDDVVMGYSGTSMGAGLIGGGTIIGAGVLDDLIGNVKRLVWPSGRRADVRLHNIDDVAKRIHGVFDSDGVALAEEAASRAAQVGLRSTVQGSRHVLNVPMGRRVGWVGGSAGTGDPLSTVRIVATTTGEVVTAYPVK
ncbi:MAG: hypothetical protein ACF8R9_05225 [Phycisphaerales bacterium JB054]